MSQIPAAGDMQQNWLWKMAMLSITPQKCSRIPVPTSALKDWILKHWSPPLHWCLSAAHHCAEEEFITWEPMHKGRSSPFPIAYDGRKSFYSLLSYWGLEMALAKRRRLGVLVTQCYMLWSGFLELLHFICLDTCLQRITCRPGAFTSVTASSIPRTKSVLHGVRIYECKVFWRPMA